MMDQKLESQFFLLRKQLSECSVQYGFSCLKGGTETEDMEFDELKLLRKLSRDILPLKVKIGGVEARTDIRYCHSIEVDTILAPMVESEYGLRNFISTLKSLIPPVAYPKVKKSINLETITGYRNILEIADSKAFEELTDITAARSDLSASMNSKPDDPEVMRVTGQIVKIAKDRGKKTCVGGTITKSNFPVIIETINPHSINSRHIVVDMDKINERGSSQIPEAMLEFEIELFSFLGTFKPEKAYYYDNRIELNRERLGNKKVLYSIR
jgi:hypothetical protein